MHTFTSTLATAAMAAGLSLGTANGPPMPDAGIVLAQTGVPQTGAAQGVNPSNSLPGGNAAFGASSTTSRRPLVASPPSGAAQGVTNSRRGQGTGTVTTRTGGASTPSAAAGASGTQGSSTR